MQILVISDIHANFTALQAVLEDAGPVDETWCLGDLVGYGPDPNECIDLLKSRENTLCLLGNHDAAAIGMINLETFNREARIAAEWTRREISEPNQNFLRGLEKILVNHSVTLAHGSPRNPVWEYMLDTFTAGQNFEHFDTPFSFVGHTHIPVVFYAPNGKSEVEFQFINAPVELSPLRRAIINPGSVGQPRDHDPRAAYAIFNPETNIWEPHRIEYDIYSVQKRIQDAKLPGRHALRLLKGW